MKNANRCAVAAVAFLVLIAAGTQAAPWTFTKLPPMQGPVPLAAPTHAEALVFQVTSSAAPVPAITRMRFRVTGNLPIGSVSTFELVAYPGGLSVPGVVVSTNNGSTWGHTEPSSLLEFALGTPLAPGASALPFVLRANVKGGTPYFFKADLVTVRVSDGGVERSLLGLDTEDLPLSGDEFSVN